MHTHTHTHTYTYFQHVRTHHGGSRRPSEYTHTRTHTHTHTHIHIHRMCQSLTRHVKHTHTLTHILYSQYGRTYRRSSRRAGTARVGPLPGLKLGVRDTSPRHERRTSSHGVHCRLHDGMLPRRLTRLRGFADRRAYLVLSEYHTYGLCKFA